MPAGVWIAMPTAPGMEWFTLMNSTAMQPIFTVVRGSISISFACFSKPCSSSLPSIRPRVMRVP